MIRNYCEKIVFPENFVYNNTMVQHYDNPAKYIMLEHSQEFAEFMVGHSDAVQALKPVLESIDDLQNLKQLLLAVPQSDSLETFMS